MNAHARTYERKKKKKRKSNDAHSIHSAKHRALRAKSQRAEIMHGESFDLTGWEPTPSSGGYWVGAAPSSD